MITKEEMIRESDLFFAEKEIYFILEGIKSEEECLRYPHNCYIWSSAIQLNFEYKNKFYFVDICHRPSSNNISIRGWHKDYDRYKTVFELPPSLCLSVLGHFSGYDKRGIYIMQPFRNDQFLPEDVKITKILETIEKLIIVGIVDDNPTRYLKSGELY